MEGVCARRGCKGDEGRGLEVGSEELALKHFKLLWSNAKVVTGEEKGMARIMSGGDQGGERERTTNTKSPSKGVKRLLALWVVPTQTLLAERGFVDTQTPYRKSFGN